MHGLLLFSDSFSIGNALNMRVSVCGRACHQISGAHSSKRANACDKGFGAQTRVQIMPMFGFKNLPGSVFLYPDKYIFAHFVFRQIVETGRLLRLHS